MTRWRKRLKEEDAEALLKETIQIALRTRALTTKEVEQVNVDTTVQEKAVAYPTDAHNYNKARKHLVKIARRHGIKLRQSYERVGEKLLRQQGCYAHARQMNRSQRAVKKLRSILGYVLREVQQKLVLLTEREKQLVTLIKKLYIQKREDKQKVYSLHAPEVECIAKGKVRKKYEFGDKVSIVSSNKGNWILGTQALHGNPYDGHTLQCALDQAMKLTGHEIKKAYCDKGYRLKKAEALTSCQVLLPGQKRRSPEEKNRMKRRNAIEPIIGHLKSDHRLSRNYLRGVIGDKQNAILASCGFNMRKLLRVFLYPLIKRLFSSFFGVLSQIREVVFNFIFPLNCSPNI